MNILLFSLLTELCLSRRSELYALKPNAISEVSFFEANIFLRFHK